MKLGSVLILCLAIGIHQTRAEPFILDLIGKAVETAGSIASGAASTANDITQGAVSVAGGIGKGVLETGAGIISNVAHGASNIGQGVIETGTGIISNVAQGATDAAKGFINTGTGILSSVANKTSNIAKSLPAQLGNLKNKVMQRVGTQVETALKKAKDATTGALQAAEIGSKLGEQGIVELENKQKQIISEWAEEAKQKLSSSSEEAQMEGQDLIDAFADQRTEDLTKCTDTIISQLEKLQEKANSTANRYQESMNALITEVGKAKQKNTNDFRQMASAATDIRKTITPLLSVTKEMVDLKVQFGKAAIQNILKHACVSSNLAKFRNEANRVGAEIDQLVAEDKENNEKKTEEESEPESSDDAASSSDASPSDESSSDAPSSDEPSSDAASSDAPSSDEPSSDEPSSDEPSSDGPSSDAPSSDAPSSDAPSSDEPSSDAQSSDVAGDQ